MLSAAEVLTTMMQSGALEVGMIVSSEANSDRHPDPSYSYTPSGAALMLDISPVAAIGFGTFLFETYDAYADLYRSIVSLKVPNGRIYLRKSAELEANARKTKAGLWQDVTPEKMPPWRQRYEEWQAAK